MIESLTPKQEALMDVVSNEWIDLALHRGSDVDEAGIRRGVEWLYGLAGLPAPEVVVVDSPLAVQRMADERGGWNVRERIMDFVTDQVSDRVYDHACDHICNHVYEHVQSRTWDRVCDCVRGRVWDRVNGTVDMCYTPALNVLSWHAYAGAWLEYWLRIGALDDITGSNAQRYIDYLRSGAWYAVFLEGVAIVSRPPEFTRVDDDGRLHCADGPAMRFRDGFEVGGES